MTNEASPAGQRKLSSNGQRLSWKRRGYRNQIDNQWPSQLQSPGQNLGNYRTKAIEAGNQHVQGSAYSPKEPSEFNSYSLTKSEPEKIELLDRNVARAGGLPQHGGQGTGHENGNEAFLHSGHIKGPSLPTMHSVRLPSLGERSNEIPNEIPEPSHHSAKSSMHPPRTFRSCSSRPPAAILSEKKSPPGDEETNSLSVMHPREQQKFFPRNSFRGSRGRGQGRTGRGGFSRGPRPHQNMDLSSNTGHRFANPIKSQRGYHSNSLHDSHYATGSRINTPRGGVSLPLRSAMHSTPPQQKPASDAWSYWEEERPQAVEVQRHDFNQVQGDGKLEVINDGLGSRDETPAGNSFKQPPLQRKPSSKEMAPNSNATTIQSSNAPEHVGAEVMTSPTQPQLVGPRSLQAPSPESLPNPSQRVERQRGIPRNYRMAKPAEVQPPFHIPNDQPSLTVEPTIGGFGDLTRDHTYPSNSQRRRESKWPARRDLKTPRRSYVPGTDNASGLPSIAGADAGSDDVVDGNEEDDAYLENRLADWDGSWAPAPVEWDSRPAFKDRKFMDTMESWIRQIQRQQFPKVDMTSIAFQDGSAPVQEDGLLGSPLDHPRSLLDPEDEFTASHIMQTAQISALERSNRVLRREKERKQRQKILRASLIEHAASYVPPPNPYAPKANIYLRPVQPSDFSQIRDIYQYYVETSVYVSELESVTISQMQSRWEDVRESKLPWLVAVDRKMNKGRNGSRENILGFGFADDYNSLRSSYRYTVELELYVRPEHRQLGIGRCLMDKLMGLLDPIYVEREGYDFVFEGGEYGPGGARVIGKVLCMIAYDGNDRTQLDWLKKWLEQWEFAQVGDLLGIGWKFDKSVNVACLQMTTGSRIEPHRGM
ncbi:hypothetical protein L228DRAFT_266484 [Xylona heveae TC161]|uniref:N-acetyltransferase domain-containing protein n=1 Tax=Xylona heveae (strain CBS 132557 / TC161) TaxID=1328760 RepID=A0A165HZ25_XYLHT|nr:hypothetical protein L228DRAFT_266484 [Xylona heveae TC161]KZF24120.1 hypothetical protein L228DRAFT_266484 [Xylona heveae TC161]